MVYSDLPCDLLRTEASLRSRSGIAVLNLKKLACYFRKDTGLASFFIAVILGVALDTTDYTVEVRDLTLLKRAVLTGSVAGLKLADLNGDLDIDAEDVKLHRDYLLRKIESFPVEE